MKHIPKHDQFPVLKMYAHNIEGNNYQIIKINQHDPKLYNQAKRIQSKLEGICRLLQQLQEG